MIVSDGIREGVEVIAEYLPRHAGLHFSMGLVEMPLFTLPGGGLLIIPRVLARTASIERTVISVPDGHRVVDGDHANSKNGDDPDREAVEKPSQTADPFRTTSEDKTEPFSGWRSA